MLRIQWVLLWGGHSKNKLFRSEGASALFGEYSKRTSRFAECAIARDAGPDAAGRVVWICDSRGKTVSSEELARMMQSLQNGPARELQIVIGGPDGIKSDDPLRKKAAFVWGFGPMTLPHELAAAVASEQIYRAFTILAHQPYHSGH